MKKAVFLLLFLVFGPLLPADVPAEPQKRLSWEDQQAFEGAHIQNNIKETRRLLAAKGDPNTWNPFLGRSSFHLAASMNGPRKTLVRLLLENKANPNANCTQGTLLRNRIAHHEELNNTCDNLGVIELLLEAKADIDQADPYIKGAPLQTPFLEMLKKPNHALISLMLIAQKNAPFLWWNITSKAFIFFYGNWEIKLPTFTDARKLELTLLRSKQVPLDCPRALVIIDEYLGHEFINESPDHTQ